MRRYAIFFIAIPVALVCVRLGFWQLSRLHQRTTRNTELRAALARAPIDLSDTAAVASGLPAFQAVRAAGRFDYAHQVVVDASAVNGVPAAIVVTPLRLEDGTAVLVDRGWVPSPDARSVHLDSLNESDSLVTVNGAIVDAGPDVPVRMESGWPVHVLRPTPGTLASFFPYPIRRYLVRRVEKPVPGKRLQPVPLPELTNGPHLSYAIQWFAFAIIAVVGSFYLYRKENPTENSEK